VRARTPRRPGAARVNACAMGLEGVVAKRRHRPFGSGRCLDWIKVKNPAAPPATRVIEVRMKFWRRRAALRPPRFNDRERRAAKIEETPWHE
jgi:hypothetical protein